VESMLIMFVTLFRCWANASLPDGLGEGLEDVHFELIGMRVVDFLIAIIELFSLDVTAEALRAKIDRKLAISHQHGQFNPKFSDKMGRPPPIFFA